MKRLLAGLVVVCTSLPILHAQTMSREEEFVRNSYAKVSLMCAVGVLTENIAFAQDHEMSRAEIDRKLTAATPTYDLSNFEVGDPLRSRIRSSATLSHCQQTVNVFFE